MSAPAALSFAGIGQSFGGVPVLRDVSFALTAGRTLGLIGENGAGKSTLMNLLGGNLRPDAGRMLLDGQPYAPAHPTDAARAGIAFIHQELNLFTNLSIAENIFLAALPRSGRSPFIDRRTLAARATGLLAQVGLPLPPTTLVENLSAGERQLVEIARALCFDTRLLILDEPTTSLSSRETATLFRLLRELRARGLTLIYISHVLEHVQQLCDDLVVLRDGAVVAQGPCADFPVERMIAAMVGRSLGQLHPVRTGRPSADPVLVVDRVRDISFTLHRGEVLGLSGLMGAGRSELARILFGLDPHTTGAIRLNDTPLGTAGPRERIRRGLAFLTEDRRHEGLCLDASVADNIALVSLARHARPPLRLIDRPSWQQAITAIRSAVRLDPRTTDSQPVGTLSGGNQQKVVLAKWLLARPAVLILDEPTRGVDVGVRFDLYKLIHELADRGSAVLLISSELEELTGLCDRILVLGEGELRGEFTRPAFPREAMLQAALPREERP
jgi:ABC-type sugar transport system ATPase subunit